MTKLLRHEFYKLLRSTGVWITSCICIIIAIGMGIILRFVIGQTGFLYTSLDVTFAFVASMFSQIWMLFIVIIIVSIVSADYQKGIIRNMVLSGHSRSKVYFSKYIVCMIYAFVLLLICVAASLFIGSTQIEISVEPMNFVYSLLMFFFQAIAYSTTAFFIGYAVHSTGASIGIVIGLYMLFNILSGISAIPVLNETAQKTITFISELYTGNLVSTASVGILGVNIMDMSGKLSDAKLIQYILTAAVTIVLLLTIGVMRFKKVNLK